MKVRMPLLGVGGIVASVMAGSMAAVSPHAVLAVTAIVIASLLVRWPSLLVVAFGVSALLSEFFAAAAEGGFVTAPTYASSVATWALLLGLAGMFGAAQITFRDRLSNSVVVRAVVVLTLGTMFSTAVAAVLGNRVGAWNGLQSSAVLLGAIAIMSVLVGRRSASFGLLLIIWLIAGEALYGVIQLLHLRFDVGPGGWWTLGNEVRWWDSRAMYGTFSLTGNKAFANSMVLLGAVILPWALLGQSRRIRFAALTGFGAVALCVVLSLARSGVISLIIVAAVVASAMGRIRIVALGAVIAATIYMLPPTHAAVVNFGQRGLDDRSAQTRVKIWRDLVDAPSSSWLIGDGYGSAPSVTAARGLGSLNPQSGRGGPATENLFIRRIVEAGLIGFGTLVAFVLLLGREALAKSGSLVARTWRISLRGLLAAFVFQSLTSDTLIFDQSAAVFALCLGVIGAGLARDVEGATAPAAADMRERDHVVTHGRPSQEVHVA
jgi:hypothetical protein